MGAADKALCFLTIGEAARLIAQRQISPVDLVEAFLARIEAVDHILATYITVCADEALADARRAEAEIVRGGVRGPLHGIPYGLKDNFMVRGVRATANSRLMADYVPDGDATAHSRLRNAGAIFLGKLNTYEYGTGNGDNLFELPFPPARNPWNLSHFPGGSTTGGGASVAAGTAMLALGSDTGGSVRLPAAACGVSGLKPTYGLVSRAGVLPNCYSLDCIGPIAWTARDAGLALRAIAGFDVRDPATAEVDVARVMDTSSAMKDLRIGVLRRFHERDIATSPNLVAGFDHVVSVLPGLGATVVTCELPWSLQDFRACSRIINTAESYAIHESDFRDHRNRMGVALRDKLRAGRAVASVDYLRAQRWRRTLAADVDELFQAVDVILCAGATRCAPDYADRSGLGAFTTESAMAAFSISGHPAISVCSGFSDLGLPLNVQLAGRRFEDGRLLVAAAALEDALGLKHQRPADVPVRPADPDWASQPASDMSEDDCERHAAESIRATLDQLPRDLPKELDPFVTVNMRIDSATQ